jgi:AcrR family transcriptional regulator
MHRWPMPVTLELIRTEGIDAVTIRRLAAEMDVKSASLYYHFHNKEEILVLAARKVLEGVRGSGSRMCLARVVAGQHMYCSSRVAGVSGSGTDADEAPSARHRCGRT